MKPVGPFWRYYGGKWAAAPRYPAPQHKTIVEPFAGAAGYACRYPDHMVTLIDADPIIAGIWAYLIRTPAAEIRALPDIPEGGTVDDLPVCQEARWLAGFWCNEGAAAPCKRPSKWASRADACVPWGGWGARARTRIARDVERIRHWRVIKGPYDAAPDVTATWFVDPPYQTSAGRHYRQQPGNFAALGAWTRARRGQVIACDQQGADWLPWTSELVVESNRGKRAGCKNVEVMYHRPSAAPEVGPLPLFGSAQ